MDSVSEVIQVTLIGSAPLLAGSVMIILRTRRDRRFAWLGLHHQLVALFFAAVLSQWVGLGFYLNAVPALT
jgi:hypothetical protein